MSWDCSTLPSFGLATRSAGRPEWPWLGHPAGTSDLMSTAGGLCGAPLTRLRIGFLGCFRSVKFRRPEAVTAGGRFRIAQEERQTPASFSNPAPWQRLLIHEGGGGDSAHPHGRGGAIGPLVSKRALAAVVVILDGAAVQTSLDAPRRW